MLRMEISSMMWHHSLARSASGAELSRGGTEAGGGGGSPDVHAPTDCVYSKVLKKQKEAYE